MAKKFSIHILIFLLMTMVLIACLSVSSFAATQASATGTVKPDSGVYLRSKTSTSSASVGVLPKGTKVTITKEVFKSKTSTAKKKRWYYVTAGDLKGYVRADCIKSVKYVAVAGKVNGKVNYRKGAGTKMKKAGSLKKGTAVTVYLPAKPVKSTKGSSSTWYRIKVGKKYYYAASSKIDIVGSIFVNNTDTEAQNALTANTFSLMTDAEFEAYLTVQGFPETYKVKLRELHKLHPNWGFIACHTGVDWNKAIAKETKKGVSAIHESLPLSYRSTAKMAAAPLIDTAPATEEVPVVQEVPAVQPEPEATAIEQTPAEEAAPSEAVTEVAPDAASPEASLTEQPAGSTEAPAEVPVETPAEALAETPQEEPVTVKMAAAETVAFRDLPDAELPESVVIEAGSELEITAAVMPAEEIAAEMAAESSEEQGVKSPAWYQIAYEGRSVYAEEDKLTVTEEESAALPHVQIADILNAEDKSEGSAEADADAAAPTAEVTEEPAAAPAAEVAEEPAAVENFTAENVTTENVPAENVAAEAAPAEVATEPLAEKEPLVTALPEETFISNDAEMATYTKVEPGWYNASAAAVAYYMDPRNFLNDDRVYMFEDLSYKPAYQTAAVVTKILTPTMLPVHGFTTDLFINAGATYNVSPVFLAARARQETGGGSITINGSKYNDKVVFNPFNIGAGSGSNPAGNALKYAYNQGWTTQEKAVNGGASFLSSGYISRGQNSIYLQKFNVANGLASVGTHQYMTNIQAPYHEAYSVKASYATFGITNEPLSFVIPVFTNMPDATVLP